MAKGPLSFRLNGRETGLFVDPGANLLDVLRRGAGDLSPKWGCGQGTCGACSVRIDGELRLACLTLAETVEGAEVETTAGLAPGPALHPLQTAFAEGFAAQCGYCTAGHADGGKDACSTPIRARRAPRWPRRSRATSAAAPATSRSSTRSSRRPTGWDGRHDHASSSVATSSPTSGATI